MSCNGGIIHNSLWSSSRKWGPRSTSCPKPGRTFTSKTSSTPSLNSNQATLLRLWRSTTATPHRSSSSRSPIGKPPNTADSRITLDKITATSSALGLTGQAVDTSANALTALGQLTTAISTTATRRGQLGATQSRLQIAISNLRTLRENFSAAESRIRDVDVAEETTNLANASILQQAGAAILAQANQQPALALSLLG